MSRQSSSSRFCKDISLLTGFEKLLISLSLMSTFRKRKNPSRMLSGQGLVLPTYLGSAIRWRILQQREVCSDCYTRFFLTHILLMRTFTSQDRDLHSYTWSVSTKVNTSGMKRSRIISRDLFRDPTT